jgi:hypothetical protein
MPENSWPELTPSVSSQINDALAAGNKIEAIKIYRHATKSGLKEAKDAIERAYSPRPQSTHGRPNSNWVTIILGLLLAAIVLIILLIRTR